MKKILVYKASGGLSHMLKGLSSAIYLSKLCDRDLLIDCKKHIGFMHNFSDFFYFKNNIKFIEDYKLIPKDYTFGKYNKYQVENRNDYIRKKNKYLLFGPYVISDKNYIKKYIFDIIIFYGIGIKSIPINLNIRVNENIKKIIKDEFEDIKGKYISVHFRNTDWKNNIDDFIGKIKLSINKYSIEKIYLATDDYNAYNKFCKELEDIKVIQYTKPLNFKGKNLHYHMKDKFKLVLNCLSDIYFILKSNIFIPSNNSLMSRWIKEMIIKEENIFDINNKVIIE